MTTPSEQTSPSLVSRPVLPPPLLAALKWLLAAAGLSGLLVTIGFLVESAYQERLGFQLPSRLDPVTLSFETGRFLFSALEAVLSAVVSNPLALLAVVILVLAISRFGPRLPASFRGALRRAGPFAVAAVLVLDICSLDLPALGVRGLLLRPLAPSQEAGLLHPLAFLTNELQRDQVCMRLEQVQYESVQRHFGIRCLVAPADHAYRANNRFALNLIVTLALAIAVARAVLSESLAARGDRRLFARNASLTGLCLVNLVLLPLTYGKTSRPTLASEVMVTRAVGGELESEHGFLLYESRDAVVFFNDRPAERHIWVLPRSSVQLIRIVNEQDFLREVIKLRVEEGEGSQAPPGSH